MWKSVFCGTLLACGIVAPVTNLGAWSFATYSPSASYESPAAPEMSVSTEPESISLTAAPAPQIIQSDRQTLITLKGAGLRHGITLTLRNTFHVYTFGPDSLDVLLPSSVRFDAADVIDGTYDVSVRLPSGRVSNVVAVKISRTK